MKKKLILLPLLILPMLVVGCTSKAYSPKLPYPGIPDDPGGGGGGGEDPDVPTEFNMVVRFYLSYSNSDELLCSMEWYSLRPITNENVPAEAKAYVAGTNYKNNGAPDDLYPVFLGWSEYPSSIDEEKLWDFENDYKQSNILSLYGIWVSEN